MQTTNAALTTTFDVPIESATTSKIPSPTMMRPHQTNLQAFFTRSLEAFQQSQEACRVLCTLPQQLTPSARRPSSPVTRLVILDSSFNPPTNAHAQMAKTALKASASSSSSADSSRLLLLLAVQNADKPPKPAGFPARLCMMEGFARDLLQNQRESLETSEIDLAVTTMPYFFGKARAIAEVYPGVEQVFLTGYDTVVRIFDPKYYAHGEMDKAMGEFFENSRLQVTLRPDDKWGTSEEQKSEISKLVGQWALKVDVVEGSDGVGISSSKVRESIKSGQIEDMVCQEVKDWIQAGVYD